MLGVANVLPTDCFVGGAVAAADAADTDAGGRASVGCVLPSDEDDDDDDDDDAATAAAAAAVAVVAVVVGGGVDGRGSGSGAFGVRYKT